MSEIHELIKKRWSPRAFDEKTIDQAILKRLFQAAILSPSSSNEQPWRFLLGVKGQDNSYPKLFDSLNEFNQRWAVHAPVIVVVVASKFFARSGKPNHHAIYDCGQAAAYLTMQATYEGLYVHQMGGFYPEKVKASFHIPDDFEALTAMVIGYIGSPEILPEDYKKIEFKKDTRMPISEIVLASWNEPAKF